MSTIIDTTSLKQAHRRTWASGDYPLIAVSADSNVADDGGFRVPSDYLVMAARKEG